MIDNRDDENLNSEDDFSADASTAVDSDSETGTHEGAEDDNQSSEKDSHSEEDSVNASPRETRIFRSQGDEHKAPIAKPFSLNSFSKQVKFKDEPREASELTEEQLAEKTALYPWFVVHTYSGFEARVKLSLEERIRNAKLQDKFGRIIVPQEQVVELVRGEKKTSSRKFFPGYILIQCDLTDESWHLVANTPKVTGFVGDTRHPVPLSPQEVQNLFDQMEGGAKKPRPKVQFEDGDSVKVVDGPFADFNGVVDEVKADKGKLRVLISIFGRNTPVELDFVQVEKV